MSQLPTKTLTAAAAILAARIVKYDGSGNVVPATAAADLSIGVSDPTVEVASGDQVDVELTGLVEIKASAAIAFGASVTAAADGKAVTAATGDVAVGWAFSNAEAADDIFLVQLCRHTAA